MDNKRQTMAERWQRNKPADFASTLEYLTLVKEFDPKSIFKSEGGKVYIIFSDGSEHVMGS